MVDEAGSDGTGRTPERAALPPGGGIAVFPTEAKLSPPTRPRITEQAVANGIRWMIAEHPHLYQLWLSHALPPILYQALLTYGLQEYPGPDTNPILTAMFREVADIPGGVTDDNAEWCATMLAVWVRRAGYPLPKFAKWSLGWAHHFDPVQPGDEQVGDIVCITRGDPLQQKGHAGVTAAWETGWVSVVGGNTHDTVGDSWYRRNERIVAVRRPPLVLAKAA